MGERARGQAWRVTGDAVHAAGGPRSEVRASTSEGQQRVAARVCVRCGVKEVTAGGAARDAGLPAIRAAAACWEDLLTPEAVVGGVLESRWCHDCQRACSAMAVV